MNGLGFDNPVDAARGDIPPQYARALATVISPDDRVAVVVLGTNEEPNLYPYEVVCEKRNGRWYEGSGSNGIGVGWTSTSMEGDGPNLGVYRLVGEAPEHAVEVVVTYQGIEHRVPVSEHGYFIFAAWDVPDAVWEADEDEPRAVRFARKDGSEESMLDDGRMLPPRVASVCENSGEK